MDEGEITRLLNEAHDGREEALDEVMELVYGALRAIAARRLGRRAGRGGTLQTTELVNEAFLRLIKQRNRYDSRGHFFAIASRAMLRVLLDYDRARRREKRGSDHLRMSLSGVVEAVPDPDSGGPSVLIETFVQALERLEALDARTAEVAKLRLLWGLSNPEIANALGTSLRTVEREWRFARRWLAAAMQPSDS